MEEVWKPVPGYEGLYEVSDRGRVRSLDRNIPQKTRWGGMQIRCFPGHMMALQNDERRRAFVALRKNCAAKRWCVSALVAAAFIGPRPKGQIVLHGDGDPSNNTVENLRYGTYFDNIQDARRHGTLTQGTKHWLAKLTPEAVQEIRDGKERNCDLAVKYGVTRACISAVTSGKNWRHV